MISHIFGPMVQIEIQKENKGKAQWGSKGKINHKGGFLVNVAHTMEKNASIILPTYACEM